MSNTQSSNRPSDEHVCCYHAEAVRSVRADRERELLELKGACSTEACRLHYAHSGPCDTSATSR